MPMYRCKAVDAKGATQEFTKEAPSEDVLVLELIQKKMNPISIKEVGDEPVDASQKRAFSRKAIIEFTETMALLLTSGLSLKDALEVSRTIFTKGHVHNLTQLLTEKINKGISFHDALSDFRGSFPHLYVGLVKIGQKIGSLENIFKRLAEYLRESKRIRDKLGNALMYPVIVLGFAVIALVGMVIFIFPKLRNIFSQLGSDVSAKLDNSMNVISIVFTVLGIIFGITISVIIILAIMRKRSKPMALKLDELVLKLPLIGNMLFVQECLNFLFAMETLTGSGFSVEDALSEAIKVVSNKALEQSILRIREKIIKGRHLSDAFLEEPLFDERIGRWVSIGERSGNVEIVFAQLRTYYQDEISKWSTRFMGIIEPVLILGVGVIVLIFLVVFFLPIFSVYQNI